MKASAVHSGYSGSNGQCRFGWRGSWTIDKVFTKLYYSTPITGGDFPPVNQAHQRQGDVRVALSPVASVRNPTGLPAACSSSPRRRHPIIIICFPTGAAER